MKTTLSGCRVTTRGRECSACRVFKTWRHFSIRATSKRTGKPLYRCYCKECHNWSNELYRNEDRAAWRLMIRETQRRRRADPEKRARDNAGQRRRYRARVGEVGT